MLPHVFDVFAQGPQALDRSQGGLGLGLAIVKNLVEQHGGTVTVASDGVGRGAEFTVRLPPLQSTLESGVAAELRPAQVQRTERVLVVDDNPDALASLADGLSERGFETYRAPDGPSALEMAGRVQPEIALLDIGLPVMDGYELARHLRELPGGERVKLIAVTGYGQPPDTSRARDVGFAEHLVKPVTLDAIEAAIDRVSAGA